MTSHAEAKKIIVTESNVSEIKPHVFSAEAAELRIAPGYVPHQIPTELGNSRRFLLDNISDDGGIFEYTQEFGCIRLFVYND